MSAKGNFKMLSIDLSSSIRLAKIQVEDSKNVWLKIPKSGFNFSYSGKDSKLLHPKKYDLKSITHNTKSITHPSNKNYEKNIEINALSSVMQIYNIDWEDLKIKNLEKL